MCVLEMYSKQNTIGELFFFNDVDACASPGNMSIRVHKYVLVGILFHQWHKINGNVYTVKIIKKIILLCSITYSYGE
mgnify:CR=1 FL=1